MSAENSYRPTSARAIVLGIIGFIILMAFFCSLAEVVKFSGAPFLILPEKLGWIPDVGQDDVTLIDMQTRETTIELERSGDYVIYAKDIDILMMTDQLAQASGNPWIKITNTATGNTIQPDFVQRALMPFDSALARGRPIFHFIVPEPGAYHFSFPRRAVTLWLLPDQVTGNIGVILFAMFLQLVIIGIPIFSLLRRAYRKRQNKIQEIRRLKKTTDEQFWQELKNQRNIQRGHKR